MQNIPQKTFSNSPPRGLRYTDPQGKKISAADPSHHRGEGRKTNSSRCSWNKIYPGKKILVRKKESEYDSIQKRWYVRPEIDRQLPTAISSPGRMTGACRRKDNFCYPEWCKPGWLLQASPVCQRLRLLKLQGNGSVIKEYIGTRGYPPRPTCSAACC